jgi:glutathione synthase/RimK-type ligase-like ATP-grasp enzyme
VNAASENPRPIVDIFSFRDDVDTVGSVTSKLDVLGVEHRFVASEDVVSGATAISLSSPFRASGDRINAWFRKVTPGLVLYPDRPKNDPMNLRGERESMYLLREFIRMRYQGRVLCDPNMTTGAENKITQLRVASEVGVRIPKTLFTNSLKDVQGFFGDEPLVYKGIAQLDPINDFYGRQADNPTTAIDVKALPEGLLINPSIFQEKIEKRAEYRVTVVGREVLVAKMTPKSEDCTDIDWRDALVKGEIRLESSDLPTTYKQSLLTMVSSMKLSFASLDVIEDHSGCLYFIDLNPSGNWYWVEDATGLDISGAVARYLAEVD